MYRHFSRFISIVLITATLLLQSSCCTLLIPITIIGAGIAASDYRNTSNIFSDNTILAQIKGKFTTYNISDVLMGVSVHVMEGRVMLTGNINDPQITDKIVKIAWSTTGVKEVINEIEIGLRKSPTEQYKDFNIGNHIKSRLILEKLKSQNYIIDVNKGNVYILGVYDNELDLAKVLTIASSVKGVKKVTSHVISRDDPRRMSIKK